MDVHLDFNHNYDIETNAELPGGPSGGHPVFYFPREAGVASAGGHLLKVLPTKAAPWLGFFAYGYPSPPGLDFATSLPDPNRLCVISRGAGYIVRVDAPDDWQEVPIFPILESRRFLDRKMVLFADHTRVCAHGPEGLKWITPQLSSDGLRVVATQGAQLKLVAYYAPEQRDFEVSLDLETGKASPQLF